ncbi:hypothetical protein [Actinomadura sp. GTD37]|uniref:hypothetical protein n=1 Tax=Actinomadura sp. GTD37 TaxID=1778030 RepID=UPI0035C177F5
MRRSVGAADSSIYFSASPPAGVSVFVLILAIEGVEPPGWALPRAVPQPPPWQ